MLFLVDGLAYSHSFGAGNRNGTKDKGEMLVPALHECPPLQDPST